MLMPRYFFNTADGTRDRDAVGVQLRDDAAARKQAIKYAGEVMHDEPDVLWDGREFRVEVVNEKDDLLFTVITLAVDAPASGQP
jgi:hypothetical protein